MKIKLVQYTGRIIKHETLFSIYREEQKTWNYSLYVQGESGNMKLKFGYTRRIRKHETKVSKYREDQKT